MGDLLEAMIPLDPRPLSTAHELPLDLAAGTLGVATARSAVEPCASASRAHGADVIVKVPLEPSIGGVLPQ
jgi:hypothetical protein